MGDEADRLLDLFWNQVDRRLGHVLPARKTWHVPTDPKCSHCGKTGGLRWKETEYGWRLHEKEHPGNRYVEHRCPTTADGFEDEPL